ncbi:MAG: carboxypeptidase regulatory-like domain-containing protein [Bryobacteraceae bacterium]
MLTRKHHFILLFWIAACARTFAQSPEGAIVGTVNDSTGARVPGAQVEVESLASGVKREATSDNRGEFTIEFLAPGGYRATISKPGFDPALASVHLATGFSQGVVVTLRPARRTESVSVHAGQSSLAAQPFDPTSSVIQTIISSKDLDSIPLAHRSFANIAYLAPMTQPVEPSDPTKARITAVSFAGSSGLNVDLSVDGGDNNDDWIGGFLQNISPDAIEEFNVRTAQFEADTSRTNGGSVIITTKRGTDDWHGLAADYFRAKDLNARNLLDNPEPNGKQPFSRNNVVAALGGPVVKQKLWFYSTLEHVHENSTVAYSNQSLTEFHDLAQLASMGFIPNVTSIDVPAFTPVPFRDTLFTTRLDWAQSSRSQWFLRGGTDRYDTKNDLIQQATLPSAGAYSRSQYYNALLHNDFVFTPQWLGILTLQANGFHHTERRNSNFGFALSFPFSVNYLTTSGFETFGDNQFATPITAFPILRDQQKYQTRYDVVHASGLHSIKFGVNFIHEPVLGGELASNPETSVTFPQDPSFYVNHPARFVADYAAGSSQTGAGNGRFSQNVQRLGFYAQESWRVTPSLTVNLGARYDTTYGLFTASGRNQDQNPAFITLKNLGINFVAGVPHDYRGAIAPRIGVAWSPGGSGITVLSAGFGLYYNDLAQNGWVDAFTAVNTPASGLLRGGDQGALIDPSYKTPYALQASFNFEHAFSHSWTFDLRYEHQQGNHQYRRYEYISGFSLPPDAPSVSLFRSDNRSRYDGAAFGVRHRFSSRFDLSAYYTLANATTWGAVVGELFDYVNGVSNVNNAFAPGDHGPAGEDVRHRFVLAGTLMLPGKVEFATLSQFESARPFTLVTPIDVNHDGDPNDDRAIVNGRQTSLDEFRGKPYMQVDLRVSRPLRFAERYELRPFVESFNLFNRTNPGNNYTGGVDQLHLPPDQLANVTQVCLDADCRSRRPVRVNDLRVPAGALGDFFGPGTTVGIPFAAQLGVRLSF